MMGMEFIRKRYSVPAKRGGRIRFERQKTGTIVAARYGKLRVRFDGEKRISHLHPAWEVEYLPAEIGDRRLVEDKFPGTVIALHENGSIRIRLDDGRELDGWPERTKSIFNKENSGKDAT